MEGMIADSMPLRNDFLKNFRVLFHIVPDSEEGSLGLRFTQFFQNKFRWSRDRAVIEGEVNILVGCRYFPQQLWIQPREKEWRAENVQCSMFNVQCSMSNVQEFNLLVGIEL